MNQFNNFSKRNGFTLIELMLAMTFISLLLLAIAMTTIQISNIYTKGITFKSVNQAGRTLSDDLRKDITVSPPFNIDNPTDSKDTSRRFVRQSNVDGEFGGRLCLGTVTYVWNYGKYIGETDINTFADPDGNTVIHLVRVIDSGGQLCTNPTLKVPKASATELLASHDNSLDLALHTFTIASDKLKAYDAVSGERMYAISFTIGTNEQPALTPDNKQCVPPDDADMGKTSDWEYCTVNQFDIVVRAGNQ